MRMVLCVVLELDGILSKEITGCARRAPFKCRTVNRIYNKQSLSGRVRPAQCGNADSSSWGATFSHPPTTSHPRTWAHISRNSTVRDYDYSAIFYMARNTHNVCVCVWCLLCACGIRTMVKHFRFSVRMAPGTMGEHASQPPT